jgi:hypothetical protein
MRVPIRRCHADAVRFARPAKIVRLKIRIKIGADLRSAVANLGRNGRDRAQTWRNFFQNKFATRELMAAVPGLVREGDQIRQPNSSMENVSGIRS